MFSLFGERPDHPMYDLAEARRLLDELPQDDPSKAMEEITFWLDSIRSAAGFTPELRIATILLLDDAGQSRLSELLQHYLSEPHLRDFHGLLLWKSAHSFALALAAAYAASIIEIRDVTKITRELKEQIPLICIRQIRALSEQMKLELMRYLDIDSGVWQQLCACYKYAEATQCGEIMVIPYPGHVIHTSPQRELLCALIMYISSPGTLATDQIEVSHRIAGRLSSFFDLKNAPDADCPYVLDLSADAPPHRMQDGQQPTADMRFFGAPRALPALNKIIGQNENDPVWQERRFGSEFTPAGKLTVLKHLATYWAAEPPHRHMVRREINASVDVTHGFRLIAQLVTHIDAGDEAEQDADNSAKKHSKLNLTALAEIEYTAETWHISDMSTDGIGVILTGTLGAWIKIGDLCAIKPQNSELWWVGAIRRLHTDGDGKIHVGIELLAKRPASVWLRVLGKGADRVSHWETSSGSFAYDYLPVILLPDEHNAYLHATMLMESGSYVADAIYQVMMGEKSRDIKLTKLIAEGEDYEQVGFEWLG